VHVIAWVKNKNPVLLPSSKPPTIPEFCNLPESGPASALMELQGAPVWMISVYLLVIFFTASFVVEDIAKKN
jgi:hypothetical protein